jgi:hypothetical protein
VTSANWAEVAAITVPTLTILGGLAHVVYRLGRLTEKVEGLENDVGRVLSHVWPKVSGGRVPGDSGDHRPGLSGRR